MATVDDLELPLTNILFMYDVLSVSFSLVIGYLSFEKDGQQRRDSKTWWYEELFLHAAGPIWIQEKQPTQATAS